MGAVGRAVAGWRAASAISCMAVVLVVILVGVGAMGGAGRNAGAAEAEIRSPISHFYIAPTRLLWKSEAGVEHADRLLGPHPGQAVLSETLPPCTLTASAGAAAGVLLDFGRELQGHVELFTPLTPGKDPVRVRVRLGESASEAMAELGGKQNAQNDHAIRDQIVTLPWLGSITIGPSGFRFVRIDGVDPGRPALLTGVRAVLGVRDIPRIGSFRCSDERLNRIWKTGADTVHLCMQDYLWDGIKRDRLVWIGDMHPEVRTISAVFGDNEVVQKSLDLTRDVTPVTQWMNGISSYSMWWVLIHEELWQHAGDRAYLEAQQPYLTALLERLAALVGPDGKEQIDGMRFLDWPSSPNKQGVTAGLQGLLVMTLDSGARLMAELGDARVAALCRQAADRARTVVPDANASKSGAALLSLAGMRDARETSDTVLLPNGTKGVSTFYGLYVLEALAKSGDIDPALDLIRTYWGGMLDMGATTFWEDFDLDWTTNAGRIDELVPAGKKDLHGDFGAYCYEGFRHSLCHGWASGPTSWMSRHLLGIEPLEPGFARARVAPRLGSLAWVEGSYPTVRGPIHVRHERQADGSVRSQVTAPAGMVIDAPPGTVITTSPAPVDREGAAATIAPVHLKCEWLENPEGIDARQPRLSWQVAATPDAPRGLRQTAYRVLVATSPERLHSSHADLWDSGSVASSETLGIVYQGAALASGQACFWSVQIVDAAGRASDWSQPARWTMGLLEAADWKADWISHRDESPLHDAPEQLHLPPAHHYRKAFRTGKPVRRAVLHGSALGLVEWSLNGRRVSDSLFEPGWTDYEQRVHVRTHDVTALLSKDGGNCLGAVVADGWYAGYLGYALLVGYGPHKSGRNIYGKTPALLGQLEIEYADGTRESIATDASWQVSREGPVREADFLMGEKYDARRELPGWDTAGFVPAEGAWRQAVAAEANAGVRAPFHEPGSSEERELGFVRPPVLDSYAAEPIRVTQELPARSVREVKPGVFIFDMGQNFAGFVRLAVEAPASTEIVLRHGEMLHPDGRLMTENLRKARATDTYICKGSGLETWSPRFTYHGFQFVELSGLPAGSVPTPAMLTGLVLHNDTPLTGRFACSDPVMTQFWKNTEWTQRANFVEVPTDCPQRDERFGWMGDAQVYARTATFNADVAAFFTKWIPDVREAQLSEGDAAGAYPDYCPYPMAHGAPGATHGTAWTDAGVICSWTMWRVYGDTRLVSDHWESMQRFMAWRLRADPRLVGVKAGNTWGDWLNVKEETPIEYIDLCFHAQSCRMMAEMARGLGHFTEANLYQQRFAALAESFRRQHLGPNGTLLVPTQTACVLALEMGLVPEAQTSRVAQQLADRIAANGFCMATGFLGTKSILPALSSHGHHDLAVRLFQNRRFPSWGYEVEQGANTVWERWDSFTKEHGFNGATGSNNAAMNSFSHYAFGAVMEWAFRTLAGIDELEPGYAKILLRPRPPTPGSNPDVAPIDWVEADYDSPRGLIRSHWRNRGKTFEMVVTVPPNTTARVHLPAAGRLSEGGRDLQLGHGVLFIDTQGETRVIEIGSGDYSFAVQTE